MTGVAWFLQLVQLPMLKVDAAREHRKRNTLLMAPVMLVEMASSIAAPQAVPLTLLVIIWIVTFALYMPAYSRLVRGDKAVLPRLIALHWIRTLCWTARAAILLWITSDRLGI